MTNDGTRGQHEQLHYLCQFLDLQHARLLSNSKTRLNIHILSITVCFKTNDEKIKYIQTGNDMFNFNAIQMASLQKQKVINLSILWNKYLILKRLARFDACSF